MAYNVQGNPLYCDAASVADFNADLAKLGWNKKTVFVKEIAFFEAANAGDELIVKDGRGSLVCKAKVDSANEDFKFGNIGPLEGLVLDTLTSGLVFFYIK